MKELRLTEEQRTTIATALELYNPDWGEIFGEVAVVVDRSNKAYGDAFHMSAAFLKLLWPEGVPPEQYADMLAIIRIFDKLMRIASSRGAFGESPARDIAGYGGLLYREHLMSDRVGER
jgi:hypothetical protein